MKHMQILIATVATVFLLLLGCSGSPSDNSLTGEWVWRSARGGHIQDHVTTELGRGFVLRLEDSGRFMALTRDSVVAEGTYQISAAGPSSRTGVEGPTLRLSSAPSVLEESDWIIDQTGDTLILRSLVDDDFDHTLIRRGG